MLAWLGGEFYFYIIIISFVFTLLNCNDFADLDNGLCKV